jgi:hypothetical protein
MIKLSKRMYLSRTDRPDEWSMDDYAREAKKLEDRIAELEISKIEPISLNQFEYAFYKVESCNISGLYEWLKKWNHLSKETLPHEL